MSTAKHSKFRHIFAKPKTSSVYTDVQLGVCSQESALIASNKTYFAVPWKGGSLGIWPVAKYGRLIPIGKETGDYQLFGHTGKITDFKFSPFHEDLLATSSEDATLKLWKINPEKITFQKTDYTADFQGHDKKVNTLSFHPTAENVLVSMGNDNCVKLWDIEKEKANYSIETENSNTFNVSWNYTGSLFTSAGTDKKMRVIDPRSSEVAYEKETENLGTRGFRSYWKGRDNKIITIGYNKQSDRQIQLFDLKNLDKPLDTIKSDNSASTVFPYFDETINVLYLCGRSDATIRLFEIGNDYIEFLTSHSAGTQISGMCERPKTECDVKKHQTMSFLVLTPKTVVPLDFFVPRKSEYFQDDIYENVRDVSTPSITAEEFFEGQEADPKLIDLKPEDMKSQSEMGAVEVLKPKYDFQKEQEKIEKEKENSIEKNLQKFDAVLNRFDQFSDSEDDKPIDSDDDW
eukprot:gene4260-7596_t